MLHRLLRARFTVVTLSVCSWHFETLVPGYSSASPVHAWYVARRQSPALPTKQCALRAELLGKQMWLLFEDVIADRYSFKVVIETIGIATNRTVKSLFLRLRKPWGPSPA
jgi:hypothetical protein